MRACAAVHDARAAHRVLRPANGRIRHRSVGSTELNGRDACDLGPEGPGTLQVETLMEVQPDAEPMFIRREEVPQPRHEEPDHSRIAVGEHEPTVSLGSLAGVESGSGNE